MEPKADARVHVVIVSHDPGLWFDEMLASVAGQDLSPVGVTVLDTGSEADPTARVHRWLPQATVRRLGINPGFGVAANQALDEAGPVPDFYVFCHDDVALAPDTLRLLATEAVRSNAGIVGPKYLEWDRPDRIHQVGLVVDKTGMPVLAVGAGELDQEQHDEIRDVFAVPGGCVLVRGDLFRAVEGFDPEMFLGYEHIDLCWRSRTVGARVVVVPTAIVRHRQRLGERVPRALVERLWHRHRVRTLLSAYGPWHLLRVLPQALAASMVEALVALVQGRLGRARRIGASWAYHLVRPGSIRRRREAVGRVRRVSDAHVRLSQAPQPSLLKPLLGGLGGGASGGSETVGALAAGGVPGETAEAVVRSSRSRAPLLVGVVTVLVVLLGARDLIGGGIPAVGGLPRLGSSSDLWRGWWSDFRPVGLGQEGFAPTGLGLLTLLSWLFVGQTELLRTVLIVAMVPVGVLGVWRLMRPFDSAGTQGVAVAVYLANPVPYNALANGVWGALLAYAGLPWLMGAVLHGARLEPFGVGPADAPSGERRRQVLRATLAVGLVLAVMVALASPAVLVVGVLVVGLVLGSWLAGTATGTVRLVAITVAGAVVAGVLHLPWLVDHLSMILGDRSGGNGENSWAEILRFDTGPFGIGRLGWALPLAAVLPLAVAHDTRLVWAVRGWTLYLGAASTALVAERGWSPVPLPRPEALLAPGALGLAMAVAMGVVALRVDVRRHRFGWRQLVPLTAVAALVAGVLPGVAVVSRGDWHATGDDYTDVAPFADEADGAAGGEGADAHRVLWLGHPDVLPLGSWRLDDRLSYAVSDSRRFPTVAQRWVGLPDDQVGDAVLAGPGSGTDRLGAVLAQWGIGTILVPERLAPAPYGELTQPAPRWLFDLLDSQLDLTAGGLTSGIASYHNTAATPAATRAALALAPDDGTSGVIRLLVVVQIGVWVAALVGLGAVRRREAAP